MAEVTKWRVGHSNAWPPLQAAPLTAPFTVQGKVVKKYGLKVVLEEQVVQHLNSAQQRLSCMV
jgi:hypothetical protein